MSLPTPRALLAPNPSPMTLDGTWTYIVGRERPAVIDPGPALPAHIAAIVDALEGATPVAIVLTHGHTDHAAAAPSLARATGAPIWLAPGGLRSGIDPAAVDHWARVSDALDTDAGRLEIHLTPGHSPDHVCIRWEPSGASGAALFVGDLLLGRGDTTFVGVPEGNVGDYLHSLEVLDALNSDVCYPGHGPPLEPRVGIARHRAHRLDRLRQVRDLLHHDPDADAEAIVARLYGTALDARLRSAAVASVQAMRDYLRDD